MNLEGYRMVFATGSLVLILIAAAPTLSLIVPFPRGSERFSELWLLGPTHMAESYPFNVRVGEKYSVFVGVDNHMGSSSWYMVYVKFRNQTQPLPNATASEPSSLPPLYMFQFFVADDETWESPLMFEILDASVQGDSMFVGNVSINDTSFSVDCFSTWDSENNGFYYQLFFELWLYDMASQSFQYHDSFVGIWLNITGGYTTIIFSDGFDDTRDFSLWSCTSGPSPTVVSSPVYQGPYSAEFNSDSEYAYITFSSQTTTCARCYVRFTNLPASIGDRHVFLEIRVSPNGTCGSQAELYKNNSGDVVWRILTYTTTGWESTEVSSPQPQTDTWYCVEIRFTINTVGGGQMWIDDVLKATCSGRTGGFGSGCVFAGARLLQSSNTFYIDSVIVADTSIGRE